jgi:hypothetical protein
MLLAFAALMPLGALLARHKWLFGDKAAGGLKPSWFQGHRAVQVTALLAALAGFIIALVSRVHGSGMLIALLRFGVLGFGRVATCRPGSRAPSQDCWLRWQGSSSPW